MAAVIVSCVFIAGAIGELWPLSGVVIFVIVIAAIGRKSYRRLTTLGSARWAERDDLQRAGMLNARSGLILGRVYDRSPFRLFHAIGGLFRGRQSAEDACRGVMAAFGRNRGELVRLPNAVHTTVFAPTGVGKSTSLAMPFLLTCEESCVVVDFKGELARMSAAHRQKYFRHQIVMLDPNKVITQPDTFNPLSQIDKDHPGAIDEANELAKALIVRTGDEKDPHWNDSAEMFIAALILMVVVYGDAHESTRSLQTVREILSSPQKLEMAVDVMIQSTAYEGMLARIGGQLKHFIDKEKSSTLTTAGRHLRFLDSLAIAANTQQSSFDPNQLLTGKMTVYLILPPNQMQTQAGLLRLWITSFLRVVMAAGLQDRRRVHFVLDEAASLGVLDAITSALDTARAYGIRLQLYYQSMGQLKKCWPNGQDQTLLSNTTQIFFGVNDQAMGTGGTADYVSARLGDETICVKSGGDSRSKSYSTNSGQQRSTSTSHSYSTNSNWQQQARRLLKPEEVVALPQRTAITFAPGVPPVCTTLLRHFEEPRLGRRRTGLARLCASVAMLAASAVVSVCWFMTAFGLYGLAGDIRTGKFQGRNAPSHNNFVRPDVPDARFPVRERN